MNLPEDIQTKLDEVSPVPDDFPKLYLLGDTGSGKTTIIRKILGTEESKFPTTRQSRTTVAPTEYVIREGSGYDITVVLKYVREVEDYIDEILRAAITKFQKDNKKEDLINNLRQTSDQRFRLYYLLSEEFRKRIAGRIIDISPLVRQSIERYRKDFPEDSIEEIIDCALDDENERELRAKYKSISNDVLAEVQIRVANTCDNKQLESSRQVYKHSEIDRSKFIAKCKEILASKADSISPLIEYARIRGNLLSPWLASDTEAVIIDGEGIGHSTKESGVLSSRHYDYFYRADAILLIEGSRAPFIGGGKNALKSIYKRGYKDKLLLLFTKLDEVEPYEVDNPTNKDRKREVKPVLDNVLAALGIGLSEDRVFYLGGLNKEIDSNAKSQIKSILSFSKNFANRTEIFIKPEYDFEMLSRYLLRVSEQFHGRYEKLLNKQHWQTIKAFSQRMWSGTDGFKKFRPITDFEKIINDALEPFISSPDSWEQEGSEECERRSLDRTRREFTKLIIAFARQEIRITPRNEWHDAYMYRGRGSTSERREDIENIFRRSVPFSEFYAKQFKDQIKQILIKAIASCDSDN